MKSLCFILDAYPTKTRIANQFVENLVNAIAERGIRCYVISPQSITKSLFRKNSLSKVYHEQRKTKNGNIVDIFFPNYLSFSSKKIGNFNTAVMGQKLHYLACKKILKKLVKDERIDALYAHFIFPSAITAAKLSKSFNIPYFFAYGENTTYTIDYMGAEKTSKALRDVSGIVAVSTKNKSVLLKNKIAPEEKIAVIPNAIDPNTFFKKSQKVVRNKLNIPQDIFLVTFVGRFLTVKGPERLSQALRELNDDNIYAVFIGTGELKPNYKNIIFEGQSTPKEISDYLSASDVFVLPTLAEGCCNAILEAMACGLPIISSDMDFNKDILDTSNSILINPRKIEDIKEAIAYIKNNPKKRKDMSDASLEKTQTLDIDSRAKKIISMIDAKISKKGKRSGS